MMRKKHAHLGLWLKRHILPLLANKKAVSVVVSSIILTAGVIAMSIAVLYWTYGMGKVSHIEYTKSTTTSMNALNERIGFEYMQYSPGGSGSLNIYIINCGKADNTTISRAYVLNNQYQNVWVSSLNITIRNIDSGAQFQYNRLGVGVEGYVRLLGTPQRPLTLTTGLYTVRFVTDRGRTFDGSFAVQ